MRPRTALAILIALALGAAGLLLLVKYHNSGVAPVSLTLRIAVDPADQSRFVIQEAGAAKFKYLVGKQSGVKPVLAQRLALKPVPNTDLVEAQVGLASRNEAQRYAPIFMKTLQRQCGDRARLTLKEQSLR